MELTEHARLAQIWAAQSLVIESIAQTHPSLIAELEELDFCRTASTFAGLLAEPELQSNCLRLELLVHLSVAYCRGRSAVSKPLVFRSFERLTDGYCGQMEDPSEDVFATIVNTPNGNYRVFEGVREGTGFQLQRVLNVIETMPNAPLFDHIRASVDAMLRLSDALADRAGVEENVLGSALPLSEFPKSIGNRLSAVRSSVIFSQDGLSELGIALESLTDFAFQENERAELPAQSIGHTGLERRPIVIRGSSAYVLLPTAIASAITRFVIEVIDSNGYSAAFGKALVREYVRLLSQIPILGGHWSAPFSFQEVDAGYVGAVMTEVDPGRFLHIISIVDGLEGFHESGFSGTPDHTPFSMAVRDQIKVASESAIKQPGFRDGISLVVACGIGRAMYFAIEGSLPDQWRLETLPAHDLVTLSWLDGFSPLSLWRLLDSQSAIEQQGVDIFNANGLLNLVAWSRELNGHLVPHNEIPDTLASLDSKSLIVVRQNAIREVRHAFLSQCDPRRVQDSEGRWISVTKFDRSEFSEDNRAPLYVSALEMLKGRLRGVYVAPFRPWWVEILSPEDAEHDSVFEHWKMLCCWLRRLAPILDEAYGSIPATPITFQIEFSRLVGATRGEVNPKSAEEMRALFHIGAEVGSSLIKISIADGFDDGLAQAENVAEHALVEAMVRGVAATAGESNDNVKIGTLIDAICPNSQARWRHRIHAQSFRDYVPGAHKPRPTLIDSVDDAAARIGLGWRVRPRGAGSEITGVEECKSFLNDAVRIVLDDLCAELKTFSRKSCVNALLENHEAAACNRTTWKRTAKASLALHNDKDEAVRTIVNYLGELNSCSLSSRILVEAAICECPLEEGATPGKLDLSRMMSKVMMAYYLGGWSDAVRWGVMEPRIRITPLGDILMNQSFMETVFEPFGRAGGESDLTQEIGRYDGLYEPSEVVSSVVGTIESAFLEAWKAEYGVSIDGVRAFLERIEEECLHASQLVCELRFSALTRMMQESAGIGANEAANALALIALAPRAEWRSPDSGVKGKDWFPWRFRRRLSMIRRPLVQLDLNEDPIVIVVPGILRESLYVAMRSFHNGEIHASQASSVEMRSWIGHANHVQRTKFNSKVAGRMRELGWQVDQEVKLTKLLGRHLDRDYGDIDVIAWNPDSGRVLLMECKDLHYHKTVGEVAEQLADFLGRMKPDGKPDNLKRHLDRIDVLAAYGSVISGKLNLKTNIRMEGHLIFKNSVPMLFAWEELAPRIRLSLFDTLENL